MLSKSTRIGRTAALCASLCFAASSALAQDTAPTISSGDTAWVMTATALVLFMTLPGLALFYGGLVRAKNYLSVLMKIIAIAALASLVWIIAGYSIAFGGEGLWWGGLSKAFSNVGTDSVAGTIPENVFLAFQMTFAIITPALIVGAFVERVKFLPVMIFTALWILCVYAPVAHWIWGGGYLAQTFNTVDFAGGLVVHATAGVSALIYVALLGPRKGFPNELSVPHRPGMVMIGASMLWVGWFGFNGGSQLAADGGAGMAILVTHVAASTATLVWIGLEAMQSRKPTLVGAATGTIAGLATVTPAAGVLGPGGAILMGFAGGLICYGAVNLVRVRLKFDDSLDVFAVHGVGGILGILLLPVLSATVLGGTGEGVFTDQLMSLLIVVGWTVIATTAILLLLKVTIGLRVTEEQEYEGLDTSLHGESAYN
ncbi:ammonium transporter [Algimonas arctica]|uniref:Ammonium transporter n=1 Tax=Algimonas arctica TaxID=1479486 RepID=A0A8J3CQQ1_9PROT|nr:ammonium transporter [Algimonas arctica]GHA87058.1 ammonium transporter [Algimonas arctica]